jgi:hypothetical protein
MFGLRVQIPKRIHERIPAFADLLNKDFLSCPFLQKDLMIGGHTSTNVPFILTIIVMMIEKKKIKISTKGGHPFSSLFDTRQGTIPKIQSLLAQAGSRHWKIVQDDLWYMKHAGLRFTWVTSFDAPNVPVDLEELFSNIVFGKDPFFHPSEAPQDQALKRKKRDDEESLFTDHIRKLAVLMEWLKKDDIIFKLKIKEKKNDKEEREDDEEAPVTGWLSSTDLKQVKVHLNDKELGKKDKKANIKAELVRLQNTYLAKAANIGMHLALWCYDDPDKGLHEYDEDDSDLPLMDLAEESLLMLKKPLLKKGEAKINGPHHNVPGRSLQGYVKQDTTRNLPPSQHCHSRSKSTTLAPPSGRREG